MYFCVWSSSLNRAKVNNVSVFGIRFLAKNGVFVIYLFVTQKIFCRLTDSYLKSIFYCYCSGCRYFSFVHALVVTALNFYILLATDTFDDSPISKVHTFFASWVYDPMHWAYYFWNSLTHAYQFLNAWLPLICKGPLQGALPWLSSLNCSKDITE